MNISDVWSKTVFQAKKQAPMICLVAGIGGVIFSGVKACKATLKLNDILKTAKEEVASVHNALEDVAYKDAYTPEDGKKDLVTIYVQTGVNIAKLYLPSVGIGLLSLACIITSHNIMGKRNAALAAAYVTVDRGFKTYRERVKDRFSDEVEQELRHSIKTKQIEEVSVDESDNVTTVEKTVRTFQLDGASTYAMIFDKRCGGYEKDSEYNLMFLRAQQAHANELLKAHKYLFLNEVYTLLGRHKSELTAAGQSVGWVYDPNSTLGDNIVDFGITVIEDAYIEDEDRYGRVIVLDFNVDGPIIERAVKKGLLVA